MPMLKRFFRNPLRSIALPLLIAVTAMTTASFAPLATAQTVHQLIELQSTAQTVRLRWPETTLGPAAIGKLVAISDAAGKPLPFSMQIAPEDLGHAMRPMWLVVRLDSAAPYYLDVGHDLGGIYQDDADTVAGRRIGSLTELPLATIRADAWGPILATLEDAQSAQQSTDTGWRQWIIILAVVGLVLIGAIAAMFARLQSRRDDVSKL